MSSTVFCQLYACCHHLTTCASEDDILLQKFFGNERYEILTAVLMKCPAILKVTPWRLVNSSWYFKGLYCLYVRVKQSLGLLEAVSRTASLRIWKHYELSERLEIFTSRYALTAPKTWICMFLYPLVCLHNCWLIYRLGSGKLQSSEGEKFPSHLAMPLAMYTFLDNYVFNICFKFINWQN